ncbi:MAG TPA: RNA-binding domain-containing protein [Thermodesulfovibrionia bacterium]|nr:RNA-binding domain-containing protein [Thermodesulfovibrionia bacterium]
MDEKELRQLLDNLIASGENECVEFKCNNDDPQSLGEYISALSNSARLHDKSNAYIVFGVEDGTHKVIGTSFRRFPAKKIPE